MARVASEIEGRISVPPVKDGTAATFVVNGVSVKLPAPAAGKFHLENGLPVVDSFPVRLTSPTNKHLTIDNLVSGTKFPGRAENGFLEGTAIVQGDYDTVAKVLDATAASVEPAENLLSGALTALAPLAINGVPVRMIPASETRMPGEPVKTEFGFACEPAAADVDTLVTANGYFAGGEFHAYSLELTPEAKLVSTTPQISITRADVRETPAEKLGTAGADVELRGFVTLTHVAGVTQQEVRVFRIDAGVGKTLIGTTTATAVAAGGGRFARWRFRIELPPLPGTLLGWSPDRFRVENASPGAGTPWAETDPEIR